MRYSRQEYDRDPITDRLKRMTLMADTAAEEMLLTRMYEALLDGTLSQITIVVDDNPMSLHFPVLE